MTPPRSPPPLAGAHLVGFVVTTDAARCRAFYQGRLGFTVVAEDEQALVLDAHGSMVRVQKATSHVPRQGTVLGWNVDDVPAAVRRLAAAGVPVEHYGFPFQDAQGVATFPGGAQVAWFKDPDGNVLSVARP